MWGNPPVKSFYGGYPGLYAIFQPTTSRLHVWWGNNDVDFTLTPAQRTR